MLKKSRNAAKRLLFHQELPPGIRTPLSLPCQTCGKWTRFPSDMARIKGIFCHVG